MDPKKIEIIRVDRDAEYEVMFEIRRIVFQEEQAVPEEIEVADDHVAHHYLALYAQFRAIHPIFSFRLFVITLQVLWAKHGSG